MIRLREALDNPGDPGCAACYHVFLSATYPCIVFFAILELGDLRPPGVPRRSMSIGSEVFGGRRAPQWFLYWNTMIARHVS